MAAFATEGRLAPQSLVSHDGDSETRAAAEHAALTHLFADAPRPAENPLPAPSGDARSAAFGKGREEASKSSELAQLVVFADMKSGSISGLEEHIFKLGQALQLLPQVWLLKTDQSANTVRNQLMQKLGRLDVLFVVDASNNKAAWFNFGPETESRIRRIWSRAEAPAPSRAAG